MFKKLITGQRPKDVVVIDSQFPQKEPFAFRNVEINEYFKRLKNFSSYAMYPMMPDAESWFQHGYGIAREVYDENKQGYSRYYPQNTKRVHYLEPLKKYSFQLAYSFFLAETYVLLPFYEAQNIPFVFVLYPGGCFGLNFDKCDAMLRKIFNSPCFRGVIATQTITRDYLLEKNLCPEDKIAYIYGGFVQFKPEDVRARRFYKKDKKTLDICFVAAKYSEKGVDKGYDIFIDVAKQLSKITDDVMFHVIGGFGPDEIDVSEIADRITFYGIRRPDFLKEFYRDMDIFLAPNRPFQLYEGNFDGFPLGIDSSYCGVALFVADELHMNDHYKSREEIEIISLESADITKKILHFRSHPDKLISLAQKGQTKTQALFDVDLQIDQRLAVFGRFAKLDSRS